MEIKDIVVEADMTVRGGAGDATNVIGNLSQSVTGYNKVGSRGIADEVSQSLHQQVLFAPEIGQSATASWDHSSVSNVSLKDVNVKLGGFGFFS